MPSLLLRLVGVCCDWAPKSKIWCNEGRLDYPITISFMHWYWFEHLAHIVCIVHDLGVSGVTQSI